MSEYSYTDCSAKTGVQLHDLRDPGRQRTIVHSIRYRPWFLRSRRQAAIARAVACESGTSRP
jgi:hypothetical protein